MQFDQFWQALCAKNPGLKDEDQKMTISVASFKSSLRQAHDMGQKATATPPRTEKPFDIDELFRSLSPSARR